MRCAPGILGEDSPFRAFQTEVPFVEAHVRKFGWIGLNERSTTLSTPGSLSSTFNLSGRLQELMPRGPAGGDAGEDEDGGGGGGNGGGEGEGGSGGAPPVRTPGRTVPPVDGETIVLPTVLARAPIVVCSKYCV